jgi:transaldolase/glucose-6-phosphate isomerase
MKNAIREAAKLGQSFWFDTLSRRLLFSGELRHMIEEDGLRGVTSNPSIFEKAMVGTGDYDADLRALVDEGLRDAKAIYEELAIDDIRAAADLLQPAYLDSDRSDGFVSLEVSPHLAHSTEATVVEGRRLFHETERDNVMIKVPGTPEGMPAIARLIGEGVNVNVTLLFGLDAYRACALAYLDGLERLQASGGDLRRVTSVASFFLSRIDTAVDDRIAAALDENPDPDRSALLERVRGKVAIANAKLAYVHYQELIASPRWAALAARGAHPQRLLWASTGTKNPRYPKTMYVDALIGPDTVNTVPAETYRAFLESGRPPAVTLTRGVADAAEVMSALSALGISLDEVTDHLLDQGIATFSKAFDQLLAALDRQVHEVLGTAGAAASVNP